MRLWTEYEGETIDGAFPLKRLLLPEGRSAFFSTANGKGDPALLRLIECHFDEDEIIARWRTIEALSHPHFLKLERYGQIELDGGPGVYALFEKADANLGEVLALGQLTVKDAAQLAGSLVSAMEMLHTHGFVHEHVQAQNVFAVGETVKLRSDCIREAPEGQAGLDAKQRDVHDLTVLVLQALTQTTDPGRAAALPAPFDKIVRNGMSGTWGLTEMRAALEGRPKQAPAPKKLDSISSLPSEPDPAPRPDAAPADKPLSTSTRTKSWEGNGLRSSIHQEVWDEDRAGSFSFRSKWMGAAGMVAVLLLLVWLAVHEWRADRATGSHAAAASGSLRTPAQPASSPAAQHAAAHTGRAIETRAQWRVIAFTYNHRDQAQKKAATLSQQHADLRPQVFTPTGHAPYLVAVGGVMNKDEAFAFARKMRSSGLPRDTYAQNYLGTSR